MISALILLTAALLAAPEGKAGAPVAAGKNATADNEELAREVRKLVRQLDAAEIAARDKAYAELLKRGPDVLAHLPAAGANTPAAVRDALGRLRQDFERKAADRAMQASLVTLKATRLPLAKFAAELEKQTGNKVRVDEAAGEATVDVDLDKTPFWKSLDSIADQGKLTVYGFSSEGLELRPSFDQHVPRSSMVSYRGPLRFSATALQLARDPRVDADASLTVTMQVAWEPRLQPITLVQRLSEIQAVDEAEKPIVVRGEGELPVLVPIGSSAVEVELPMIAPPRNTKAIASLKGALDVLVPGKIEEFVFENLKDARKAEQQKSAATVTLESVRKSGDVWEVRLRLKYDQAFNAFDSYLAGWILNNEAVLINPQGERLDNGGYETTFRDEGEIGIAYFFDLAKGPEGHKFVYRTAGTIHRIPVEYELKDLELP